MYHYIYNHSFITSDEPLDPNKYPIGQDINDYASGMYVPLNEQQIEYEQNHLNAPPEEVWEMRQLPYSVNVDTPEGEVRGYSVQYQYIYINNNPYYLQDFESLLTKALCAKHCNESTFTFILETKLYSGDIDYIIDMLYQIGLFYHKFELNAVKHVEYIQKHPSEIKTYDYTTGYPAPLYFNLEEVYDFNQS